MYDENITAVNQSRKTFKIITTYNGKRSTYERKFYNIFSPESIAKCGQTVIIHIVIAFSKISSVTTCSQKF